MESTPPIDDALVEISRAQLATWAPRPIPRWYWWSIGLLMGGLWALLDVHSRPLSLLASAAYAIGLAVVLTRYFRTIGFAPRLRGGPRCPARLRRAKWLGGLLLIGVLGAVALLAGLSRVPHGWLVMAVAAVVTMVVLGPVTERMYERAYQRWLASQP